MAHIQMWPTEVIALNRELASGYHTRLEELLQAFNPDDLGGRLACIAAYCEIIVDDYYDADEIARLAGMLANALEKKRTNPNGVIYLSPDTPVQ